MADQANDVLNIIEVGGEDKGYLLLFKEESAYLTVYAHESDKVLFDLTDITKALEKQNFHNYEMDVIAKTIREGSGEPVLIAGEAASAGEQTPARETAEQQSEDSSLQEPVISFKFSKGNMEAFLTFQEGKDVKRPTEELIRRRLAESGIVYGIQEGEIQNVVAKLKNDVCIARGLEPINGSNAFINRHFDLEACGRPEEIEHGRVDFKNLNLFITVQKGDLLAERIPATEGTPGMSVFGKAIAPKPGKSMVLPAGKNTAVVDEHKIVADIEGQLVETNGRISVDATLEIRGDVDVSTGNIDFCGAVLIKGSVQAGFSVRADGNIEISGNISGGTVEGRNIVVRAGIQGMQRGYIKAEEDIRSSFVENAKLIAGRDVFVTEAALHSEISAGQRVVIEGKRGVVAGGAVTAGMEIRVKSAGNQMDTSTKLEVGVNPMLRDEYRQIKKEMIQVNEQLDQAQKALKILKGISPDKLTPDKQAMLLRLTKSQFPLAGEVKKYKDRMSEIEKEFVTMQSGKIRVSDFIYPGVKLIIGSVIRNVRTKEQRCMFYAEKGEIRMSPY